MHTQMECVLVLCDQRWRAPSDNLDSSSSSRSGASGRPDLDGSVLAETDFLHLDSLVMRCQVGVVHWTERVAE